MVTLVVVEILHVVEQTPWRPVFTSTQFTDIRRSGPEPPPVLTGEFVARVYKVWDRSEVADWSWTAPASLS